MDGVERRKVVSLKPAISRIDTFIATPMASSVAFGHERRGTPAERGYGWEWVKKRRRIMARDGRQCQQCKRDGRVTAADEVDHVINRASGGSDDDDNLQALCHDCHVAKSDRERLSLHSVLP